MKSMNVKRLAAIGLGALMAAGAAAAVSVDSTGLSGYKFFTNGEPAVKIAVGSKAMPSDGVVAANIAAMLGNLAYTDQSVSVVGKDGLSCAASGNASGSSCAVSSASKIAHLSVTVPGASPANVYTMKTYINDNLDNQTEITRSTAGSFNGDVNSIQGWSARITKDKTSVLTLPSNGAVSNPRNRDVKQEQVVYLFGTTVYDTTAKVVVSNNMKAVYALTFSEPLPICWDTAKTVSACPAADWLNATHTKIKLLGQDWVVISYTLSGNTTTALELGKETAYSPYMNIDDELVAANGAKVKLKSVSPFGYGGSSLPYASFEVTSASGTTTTETMQPGDSKDVAGVTIRVNKVFPGVNNVNYADVSVFSDKLTLTNGQQIDSTTHQYWYPNIGSTTSGQSAAINNITLYSTYVGKTQWKAGEKLALINGANALDFTFGGLDDASVSYDTLQFTITNSTLYGNSTAYWTGPYVDVQSGVSNAFQHGSSSKSTARIALRTLTGAGGAADAAVSTVFYQDATTGYWLPASGTIAAPSATNETYYYSASESTMIGVTGNATWSHVWVKEFDEDNQAGTAKYLNVLYDPAQGSAGQFVDAKGATTTTKVGYNSTAPFAMGDAIGSATYEVNYVTNRGVKLTALSSGSMTLSYPKTVVKAKYSLTATGTNATSGSITLDLGVGQSGTIDTGYVATVSGIDASATGAAGACALSGDDALSASQSSAAVVAELNTRTTPLVVLDRDASSAEPLIVVGGPAVNSLAGAGLPASPGQEAVVKVDGFKIFVAGYSAGDTADAGNELIKWLGQNRASIRG